PDGWPESAKPPIVSAAAHGKSVASTSLTGGAAEQLAVDPTIQPDPEMQKALAAYAAAPPQLPAAAADSRDTGAPAHPAAAAPEPDASAPIKSLAPGDS